MDISGLIAKAQDSKWGMKKLNLIMQRGIPFNKPHSIEVISISNDEVKVKLPYKRKNLNHIKGLHACGLATASEYSSGLLLLHKLGFKQYRLIMESMEMKYHYQGKMDAIATFTLDDATAQAQIIEPLKTEDKVYIKCEILVHDTAGNHLCTGYTNWQIKPWNKVKTK